MAKGKSRKGSDLKAIVARAIRDSKVPRNLTTSKVVRWCRPTFGAMSVADSGRAWSYQISDLPNVSELTSSYDFYAIDRVDVEFHLMFDLKRTSSGTVDYPLMILVPDYDDAVAPLTELEVLEYGKNVRLEAFSGDRRTIKITLVPRLSNTVYRTGVTSAYTLADPGTLVDCTNADAPHYGLKAWVSQYNSTDYSVGDILMYVKYQIRLVANR